MSGKSRPRRTPTPREVAAVIRPPSVEPDRRIIMAMEANTPFYGVTLVAMGKAYDYGLPEPRTSREPARFYGREGWPPPPEPTEEQPVWVPWPVRDAVAAGADATEALAAYNAAERNDPLPAGMTRRVMSAIHHQQEQEQADERQPDEHVHQPVSDRDEPDHESDDEPDNLAHDLTDDEPQHVADDQSDDQSDESAHLPTG